MRYLNKQKKYARRGDVIIDERTENKFIWDGNQLCDEYNYYNKEDFALSWANDPILQPALSETDLMKSSPISMTGSIKYNGCSIVYPGVMNIW